MLNPQIPESVFVNFRCQPLWLGDQLILYAGTPNATSKANHSQTFVSATRDIKTSTRVLNNLARRLLESSPEQASLAYYLGISRQMGKLPTKLQKMWMDLRRITTQMQNIERDAINSGRTLSNDDRMTASTKGVTLLRSTLAELSKQGKMAHPSFRMELIEHLENIIYWCPTNPSAWILAHKYLLPREKVRLENRSFNKEECGQTKDELIAYSRHNRHLPSK